LSGWAIIFDVDGVLLELTEYEEKGFFDAFRALHGIEGLSNDWDSYRVRNDEEIAREILERHFGRAATSEEVAGFKADYLARTEELAEPPLTVPGAQNLLEALADFTLGIATANFRDAARIRLQRAELWPLVAAHAFGAEGGGAKRAILARAMASTGIEAEHTIYIGDNLNDLDAGRANGTNFIGFSRNKKRRSRLSANGAQFVSSDHAETLRLIGRITSSA
jgi:HAD superfamily hydrolase (TIGR01549 family)